MDSKTLWKYFKILTEMEPSIPVLSVPGSGTITNNVENATILNECYLTNFNHAYIPTHYSWLDSSLTLPTSSIPEEYLCSDELTFGLLSSFNTRKAAKADGITA